MAILEYTDLTVSAITNTDPYFLIPSGYIPPSFYPLEVDLWRYRSQVVLDKDRISSALYGSIVPLLEENIRGYSLALPGGAGQKLLGRSIFTYDLLNTAKFLYSLLKEVLRCLDDSKFFMAVDFPLCCKESNIIYNLREI